MKIGNKTRLYAEGRPLLAFGRRGNLRAQKGQTLVEMAILIPAILLLLIGVIEIGRYTYIGILVGNAARAGAEFGIQGNGQAGNGPAIILAAKTDFKNNGQDPNNLTVSFPSGYGGFDACTCDNGGAYNPAQPYMLYCTAPPNGTNTSAGKCPTGQHWVILTAVEAHGTFNSILIPANSSFLGIPGSIPIDRTSILRAPP
jgi:Flp pilus assembly protein TadG